MKFQKFHLNRIKYLILILLSITFTLDVKAIVEPTDKFYVNDYADILSNETEEYIIEKSLQLYNVDGTQIVVVTVPNLEGMSIEDYSIKVARSFKIGSKEKDNGLLLLIALEERELRIEVGAGLEGIIPDGKAGRFRDQYMIPYLKNNKWDEGIKNGYDAFFKEIVELNNLNLNYTNPTQKVDSSINEFAMTLMFFNILFALFMGWCINVSNKKARKTSIYLIILGILFVIAHLWFNILTIYLILHLIFFVLGRLGIVDILHTTGGGFYGGSGSSRGGSSRGGGFSGGGGSFRGGGASGRF